MENVKTLFGKNITDLRVRNGWTRAELSRRVGISPAFMTHIEHGTRGVSLDTIDVFSKVLGVEIPLLFAKIDEPKMPNGEDRPSPTELEAHLKEEINHALSRYVRAVKSNDARMHFETAV